MAEAHISSVGDHFLVGLRPSVTLHERDQALLRELRPAGVILYKSNFLHDAPYHEWLQAHARLVADIRGAIGRERIFIAIDHEGGRVCRTPAPITRFSYAASWAQQAGAIGSAMGRELSSLGINLNFAPVLDIHSNPANPVIGPRAFGETSEQVIGAALAFMSGLQAQQVLACGKHFPGHGDTDSDSHHELPVLHQTLRALRERELEPFAAAIRAGIAMIMTGHIMLPAVDALAPVTLSYRFNQQLLREQLGFGGVIVSDDVGMRAVSGLFADPAAAPKLICAGADMLMISAHWTDTDRCRGFARALIAAQDEGSMPAERSAQSRARVQALLGRAAQPAVTALPAEVFEQHRHSGALFQAQTVEVV
ncbi:MAG TPA: glycoside hydrolase family 3 N-terminal domain-containing protein [Steroidobacteraceae bacterium]|nr:glycoside hydrolase family 3 N-terminal domain-containing protein [Steroidobacteraceae bacterium]